MLISKIREGDYLSFTRIFTTYYQDLVIFASGFIHDRDNAEEIVQDTFVRLWEEHESLQVNVAIRSYLLKMVQNRCIDWYRHQKIKQKHSESVLETTSHIVYDTDNYILHSELERLIANALEKMPEAISDAFRMNREKGLKYHEIATIHGVSVRTIEVRIGKALNLLRNYLEDYLPKY